jgi:digeranylgeranylglycerophospholipid reductase
VLDVAIIGAGPAGLTAATHLAESGLDVVLFEEHQAIGVPTHCTGIVSLETAALAKIPDDMAVARLRRARLLGPHGARADHAWVSPTEQIVAIDRAAFDRSLAHRARATGATLLTGMRVTDVEVTEHAVILRAGEATMSARACILACGVSYRFQRRLGLGLPGQVLHTAQLEVPAVPGDVVHIYFGQSVAAEGFAWTVPLVRDGQPAMKVGVMARGDAATYLLQFLARPEIRDGLTAEPGVPVRRLLPVKTIPKTYGDRVLVVGDAGGFTKPTTGGGIFYSVLTATFAAETLIDACAKDRLDEGFLSRYEKRWQDELGQDLRVSDWLRGIVTKCTDPEIDALVRAMASSDVQALIARTARFNWHRDVILSMVRQPGIKSLIFRALFR